MIKLSIITPTYNRANKIIKNLTSIKNTGITNIEHIIIDNLSTDNTDEIVQNYQKEVSYPVIYIREKDSGIYNAMNKGIKSARGEWIHILNSDDYYTSSKALQDFFQNDYQEYDLVAYSIIQKNGQNENRWNPEVIKHKKYDFFRFPHPGIIIKKNFYEKHGLYNEKYRIISDAVFNLQNLPKAKYLIINQPLVYMELMGVSAKFSFRHFYEFTICVLFYHRFPINIKVKYIFNYLFSPLLTLVQNIRFYFISLIKRILHRS